MKDIKFLGIPFSGGQDHSGVEKAPQTFRDRGLLQRLPAPVRDLGDLDFSLCGERSTGVIRNERLCGLGNALISAAIESENLAHSFLLNLGGDHGLALGTIHGVLAHFPDIIVVWADAHGDVNTPQSSPTGNFHGMPLSFLLRGAQGREHFSWIQRFLKPNRLIYMGPRDLDPAEKTTIEDLGIQWFSSDDIRRFGAEVLLRHALKLADPSGLAPIHLSFDVDVFDPSDVVATGTQVEEGPEKNELIKIAQILGGSQRLRSMDLVEVNPDFSHEKKACETLDIATRLILSVTNPIFRPQPIAYTQRVFPSYRNFLGISA